MKKELFLRSTTLIQTNNDSMASKQTSTAKKLKEHENERSTLAAVLHVVGQPLHINMLTLTPPARGEVLVRMQAAGVCRSDWHVISGDTKHPLPAVLGHEGAGVVEQVGEGVSLVHVGDTISLSWAPYCGACFHCTHEQPFLCSAYDGPIWKGAMMDGTTRLTLADGTPVCQYCSLGCFSEYCVVNEKSCILMPATICPEVRALIGCAVTTGVGAATHTANIRAGDTVAVIGGGGVGLSAVMGAVVSGASKIILVDRHPSKRQAGLSVGATHFVQYPQKTSAESASAKVLEKVLSLTNGVGVDVAIEAVGIPALQQLSIDIIRPGGTAVLVGLAPMHASIIMPTAKLTRQHKTGEVLSLWSLEKNETHQSTQLRAATTEASSLPRTSPRSRKCTSRASCRWTS
eukprot:TRINITY_DN6034_c0_g1_i2.p1 TRINITY_DN6034_c0_g1~~TRINITY_DN6034_c0_g1_i2.p1  ORF type:complete len:403 (-),score=60.61 TRINITY_DN6034_c0_g1_i2:172-1380(-)